MIDDEKVKKVAVDHVDWYLNSIRPLLIDHMVHGIKHGVEEPERFEKGEINDGE